MVELPIFVRVSSLDLIDTFDRNCIKDITLSHYMDQPRSMLCRKLERNFIEKDFGDFDYNWFPNCFRHMNALFCYYINGHDI